MKQCLTVFLDLAKAFYTVSISHPIKKLVNVGVRRFSLKLLEGYLTDRRQRMKIDNRLRDELVVEFGIQQGSILGPTLFLVYINYLCKA